MAAAQAKDKLNVQRTAQARKTAMYENVQASMIAQVEKMTGTKIVQG